MNETTALLLGLIPALLILLCTLIIRRTGPEDLVPHRSLLFFEISILVVLGLLFALELLPDGISQRFSWVSRFFIPSIFGLVVLFLIGLPDFRHFSRKEKISMILPALAIAAILGYYLVGPYVLRDVFPPVAILLLTAWLIPKKTSRWIWLPFVLVCAMWVSVNGPGLSHASSLPPMLARLIGTIFLMLPALTIAVMAILVTSGLGLVFTTPAASGVKTIHAARIYGGLRLAAALMILILLAYSITWAAIWDQTSDGLGGIFFAMYSSVAAIVCGMVMAERASGRSRMMGVAFLIIVPVVANISFARGTQIDFPQLTEQRAARVADALERFHSRENRYPTALNELVPFDLLYLPQPVMFRGENWCYQATVDAYRLAAFYHQYFGLPVSLDIYASSGNLDNQPLPCAERLADMQALYDWTNLPLAELTTDTLAEPP